MVDAKAPVHALRRSGLPGRMSCRRSDRSISKRNRRFSGRKLYRLPVLRFRMSVQCAEIQSFNEEGLQVYAVLRPCWFGDSSPLVSKPVPRGASTLAQRTTCSSLRVNGSPELQQHAGLKDAGIYDPQTIGGTSVVYILHDATNPGRNTVGYPGTPRFRLLSRSGKAGSSRWD